MKTFEVLRYGLCIECGQIDTQFLGEYDTETKEEAIEKAQENWLYEQFGQAGALRENDLRKEEEFLNADFHAKEIE